MLPSPSRLWIEFVPRLQPTDLDDKMIRQIQPDAALLSQSACRTTGFARAPQWTQVQSGKPSSFPTTSTGALEDVTSSAPMDERATWDEECLCLVSNAA